MGILNAVQPAKSPAAMALTLRVLARLLDYPDTELRRHLDELSSALHDEGALQAARLAELVGFIQRLDNLQPLDGEAEYVELFDRGRGTSLLLFEHVHGDSRDRGPAMIDLAKTYEQAGLYLAEDEMPDHLPTLLEFASTQPSAEARALLGEISHIVRQIFSALVKRGSPYASVLAAVLELAGEKAQTVSVAAEPDLDEAWEEPAAFDGCSVAGQSRPAQANHGEMSGTGTASDPTQNDKAVPEYPVQFVPSARAGHDASSGSAVRGKAHSTGVQR